MAVSYDNRKKSYDAMDDSQKQKYNEMAQSKWDSHIANQYIKQWQQEQTNNTPQQASNESNFNNQNDTKQENSTPKVYNQTTWYYETPKKEETPKTEVNPDLNVEKFWETNWQVSVKEWTAQQTGRPDYQLDSDARMQEITNNLNAYRQNNPEYFKDRQTFNTMFHYNDRDDSQKALLDTYWKKKQDIDKANLYTSWDSITNWMKDAEITPDQLNYIKEYSPEAYREWQQKQLDDINLRIANLATPADPTDNAELFNTLLQKLNLEPWDPYQIYDNWYSMCERLGVFSDSEKLKSYQNQLDANHSKMESIMNRYASSTWWTVSDALAAARMQKALAPYQQREVDLQNSYTTLLNWRNSNLAVANQSAQALAMQAAEDQRVWSERLQWLNFSLQTAQFRTPEQTQQLNLQVDQIRNNMSLLQQSKQNDLSLYNQYATSKLNNQLNYELTDLSVQDETQLKANLNNILSGYYSQYWDIIQRSQQQALEDILKYAKEKNIPVAQALTENFIKQLQTKDEYKQKIKSTYLTNNKSWYSKITLNGKDYLLKDGELVDMDFLDDGDAEINIREWLATFLSWKQDWQVGGWCWTFVNDYLQSLWLGRLVKDSVQDKKDLVNIDKSEVQVWDVAVFDYSWLGTWKWNSNQSSVSENSRKYGHVAIVTDVDRINNTVTLAESNYEWDKKITTTRKVALDNNSLYGFYSPTADVTVKMWEKWYSESRIWAYDKYLTNWTLPSDAKLKSMGWLDQFEAEVEAYKNDRWITTQYSQQAVDQVTELRKEFDKLDNVQAYRDMQTYYNKILASSNWTAAGDMSLIFAYMKMLDPRSVVREWEFATAQQTTWIPERVVIAYNQALNWTRLSEKQRTEFTNMAKQYLSDAAKLYNQELARYQSYVTYGWDKWSIWDYATIPWVYNINSFQSYSTWYGWGSVSDIDALVASRANM